MSFCASCRALIALACLAFAGASQVGADRLSRFYEDGLARFEKGDWAGAIVQLKNALQEDPRNLAANVLIGKAYLANVQPADAENALEKAIRLGADRSEIVIPLAEALLVQGKGKDVLVRFPPESAAPAQLVELLVLRGHASRQDNDEPAAIRAFEEAMALDSRAVGHKLSLADIRSHRGAFPEALRLADEAIRIDPSNAKAVYVKGTILQGSGDAAGALKAYGQALAVDAKAPDARLARATLLLDLGRDADAKVDLDFLGKEHPLEPRGNYLRAVYLSRKGEAAGAQAALLAMTRLLDPVPVEVLKARTPELLLLGALAYHALANMEKSIGYAEQFLALQPNHVGARKLLGTLMLERRDAVGAIKILEPAVRMAPRDAQTLALLSSAYMARGRGREAARLLEQALSLSGATPQIQANLGFSQIEIGQQEIGQRNLEQAFEKDASLENVGVALALLYIRKGMPDRAVATAQRLAQRHPSNLGVLNLLGVTMAAAGDAAGARNAYDKAIQINPAFTPVQLNYAKLEVAEGNYPAARSRLTKLLNSRPKDGQALFELGRLEAHAGRLDESVRWLEKLRGQEPGNVRAATILVDVYLRKGDSTKALETARAAESYGPQNLDVLASVAMALVAAGNGKQAKATLARMTKIANFDAPSQLRIAELQLRADNPDGAAYSLDKALSGDPAYLPARVLKVEVELMRDLLERAEATATEVRREFPEKAVGLRLVADVAFRRGRFAEALANYRAALDREPSRQHALAVYRALIRTGGQSAASGFLEAWQKRHPPDPALSMVLAEASLRAGDLGQARRRFEAILAERGESPVVLNNLAIIAARQGDSKALALAHRALELAPTDALVLDTVGWLLVQLGSAETGLRYLREAQLRAPANPEIRYHLAAALAKSGRIDDARRELDRVLSSRLSFAELDEARKLSRELSLTQ